MVKAGLPFSASLSAQIYSVNLEIETRSEKHMLLVFFMNNICGIKLYVSGGERVRLLSFMHFSPCFPHVSNSKQSIYCVIPNESFLPQFIAKYLITS